jgi:crotonobetainyl-CoA:carnitine CoA-transferase CaiB-like acyl-CoA transferase
MAPLRVFATATSDILVMAAKNEEFERLCGTLGMESALADPRFATNALRVEHRADLHALMADVLRRKPADHWMSVLGAARIACTQVRSVETIAADDDFERTMQSIHRHPRIGHLKLVRNPLTIDGESLPFRILAPAWAQDTDDVLGELGLGADELESLRDQGIIA